ncbi:hypothetical protein B0I35DRAFT_105092 [Stachybotrys elegans]|uniref:Uncharacterized protein n=1 Tax=Stachybotrys elegans TaxID=80388 RepID=A0A8K0SH98_9HYPO|nr:hypothetical protein B0I35DRAFT_105092 [Stachybotrys elegans]
MSDPGTEASKMVEFDSAYRESDQFFYFHHVISGEEASLKIEVIGPNLTHTFHHSRARQHMSFSTVVNNLSSKTVGYLALVQPKDGKRVVLTWAESGHGGGIYGDVLDPAPGILSNQIWTQRTIMLGKVMGFKMRSIYDGRKPDGVSNWGVYRGSHVEVKLATHAILTLLKECRVTEDLDHVTLEHLQALRQVQWEKDMRPTFEIYFSRKNCPLCGNFTKRLSEETGIPISLEWRDRLVPIEYKKGKPLRSRRPGGEQATEEQEVEEQDSDFGDGLSREEAIDLTEEMAVSATQVIDLTNQAASVPPAPCYNERIGAYIDGLAYCVGQIDQSPQTARQAILDLAERHRAQHLSRISKPLPPTAEVEAPLWMGLPTPLPTPTKSADHDDGSARSPRPYSWSKNTEAGPVSTPTSGRYPSPERSSVQESRPRIFYATSSGQAGEPMAWTTTPAAPSPLFANRPTPSFLHRARVARPYAINGNAGGM